MRAKGQGGRFQNEPSTSIPKYHTAITAFSCLYYQHIYVCFYDPIYKITYRFCHLTAEVVF